MNANIIERASQIIRSCDIACLGVIDENNYPSVSMVSVIRPENIYESYFATGINANKTKRLQKNRRASLCYQSGNNIITLVGETEILTDQPTKDRLWLDGFINHFQGGKSDPNYCVIKFKTERISLLVDGGSVEFKTQDILTIQSRCGLLCRGCTFKASHGCGGCIETSGHPFYGECPIAMCCQNKGFSHCGECAEMPCQQLYEYSCGDSEHCDKPKRARLSMLMQWTDKPFFQCGIIEESLTDLSILNHIKNYHFMRRVEKKDDEKKPEWHINGYWLSHEKLISILNELKLIIKQDWYIHAFNETENTLYVVLKDRVFKLPCVRDESWDEMICYGESIGLERILTENIPLEI